MWSGNPQERLNTEIRRSTYVVGVLPDQAAIRRLIGAVLARGDDGWAEGRLKLIKAPAGRRHARGRSQNQSNGNSAQLH